MSKDLISNIVAALQTDQREQYAALIVSLPQDEVPEELWKAIGAAHGNDFDLFERMTAWSVAGVNTVVNLLVPAVSHIPSLTLTDAKRFLQFTEQVEPSFRHCVSEQLKPHIASVPELGKQLGEAVRLGGIFGQGAHVWAGSFSKATPLEAAQFAMNLLGSVRNDAGLLAILLQHLPAHDSRVISLLQPQQAKFADVLVSAAPTVGRDAWFALTAIAGFSTEAVAALQQSVVAGEVHALVAVANWLHVVSTPTFGATDTPIEEVVKEMLRHATTNDEVRGWTDSAVSSLLHRASLRGVVISCLAELKNVDGDVENFFNKTFNALCCNPKDFTKLLTEWLLAEGASFTAIRSLIARCSAQRAPTGVDGTIFAAASPDRQIAAMRRLTALTFDGPVLCLFISSLAETPALQPLGLELATHMLNDAFSEYPDATVKFLKLRTRPAARKETFAHVYRGVYANALRWRRVLNSLPQINELRPTDAQRHALRAMRLRLNREIMHTAETRSVFASLFRTSHIAQGRHVASHTEHGPPQVVALQQSSHTMELPSSELADPVGGALRRASALGASR